MTTEKKAPARPRSGPIDIHTHTFPDALAPRALLSLMQKSHTRPFADATNEGLGASMREAGIALSVVQPVATSPQQVVKVNDTAIRVNEQAAETGIMSFGAMHPDYTSCADELKRLKAAGIRGVKLHPPYQGVDFDDPRYLRILEAAGALGLTVLIHAGLDIGLPGARQATPEKVKNAVRQVGPVRLVLAHMGGWRCWDRVLELLTDAPVMLDTSFSLGRITPGDDGHPWTEEALTMLSAEEFVDMVRAFGAERVLFGTDSPWGGQRECVAQFMRLPLSDREKALILRENAEKLLL